MEKGINLSIMVSRTISKLESEANSSSYITRKRDEKEMRQLYWIEIGLAARKLVEVGRKGRTEYKN
jgi:hypothetical protein